MIDRYERCSEVERGAVKWVGIISYEGAGVQEAKLCRVRRREREVGRCTAQGVRQGGTDRKDYGDP